MFLMKKKSVIFVMIVFISIISICYSDTGENLIPVPAVVDGILKYGYIDFKGNMIIPPIYNYAGDFKNGKAHVATEILGMRHEFTDENGKTVITKLPVKSNYIDDGIHVNYRGMSGDGSTSYVINEKGETILKSDNFGIIDFFNNYAITYKDYKAGLADNNGNVIFTDIVNDSIRDSYNLLIVNKGGYFTIYDKDLNIIEDKLDSYCFSATQPERIAGPKESLQSKYCVLKRSGKSFIYDITARCKYMDINVNVNDIQQVGNFLVVRDAANRKFIPINLTTKKVLYNTKSDVVFSFLINKSKVTAYAGATLPTEYHGEASLEAFVANEDGRVLKIVKKAEPRFSSPAPFEAMIVFTVSGGETWHSGGGPIKEFDNNYTVYNGIDKKFSSLRAKSLEFYLANKIETYRKNRDRNFYYNGNAILARTDKETIAYDGNMKIIFKVNNSAKKTVVKSVDGKYQFLREAKNISVLDNKGKVIIKPMEYMYEDDKFLYLKENGLIKRFDRKTFSIVTEEEGTFVLLDGNSLPINYNVIVDKNKNLLIKTMGVANEGFYSELSYIPNISENSKIMILPCYSAGATLYYFFKNEGDRFVYITKGKNFNTKSDRGKIYFDANYLCVQTDVCLEYYDNDGKLIYKTDPSIPLRN